MAEPEVQVDIPESTPQIDIDMGDDTAGAADANVDLDEGTNLPDIAPDEPERLTFLDYLRSPMVDIVVGAGEEQTTLHAHQAVLTASPYFASICADFATEGPRTIDLPEEDITATGSVLEYLYNGEYFPRRANPADKASSLEDDPSVPRPDDAGAGLLRHARVYTLADKLSLPALKSLAHSKIHRTSSTAKGELSYARYVYSYTSPADVTIRHPVAAFWATRSHVLRHEAEAEFRAMCLEFPQFGFDVLSRVLDAREKGKGGGVGAEVAVAAGGGTPGGPGSRKRARVSHA